MRARTALIVCCSLLFAAPLEAQTPAAASLAADLHAKLESRLLNVADHLDGVLGYSIRGLTSGETFEHNADLVFPTASSIKLAILLELMRQDQEGKLSLDEKHTLVRSEMTVNDDEPILTLLGDGTVTMSLRDVAKFMVVLSDNTATNILIDRVGLANVDDQVDRLGLTHTRLRRRMIDIQAAREGRENVSTPRELAALIEKVHAGGVLDAAHTREYFNLLALPKESLFHRALPSTVRIEDKPGALDRVRCDAGLIEVAGHPFVMAVMTTYLASNEDGERAVEEIARLAYEHFDRLSRSSAYGRYISEQ